jgi:glyoxylase-like metal-dependent hydrolase (beta-lactamase superfamily II)
MIWNNLAKIILAIAIMGFANLRSVAIAQDQNPMLAENAEEKLSEHIYMIRGFPNIVIVVGKKATLVVDTGLGPANGEVVARTAARLGGRTKFYLTTTHFHPEHAAGEGGFPDGTVLIRAKVQQEELEQDKDATITRFRMRREQDAALLKGVTYRKPDIIFETSYSMDLGGVHAQLLWAGRAHTKGDVEIYIEEDKALISGDVIQNRYGPVFATSGSGTAREWLRTLEVLNQLNPKLIIPDHSPPGDAHLIVEAQDFLKFLDNRAHTLKGMGIAQAEAGKTINAELRSRYPDWELHDVSNAVGLIYAE